MSEVERQIFDAAVNIQQNNVNEYMNSAMSEEMLKYQQSPYFANCIGYYNGADEFSRQQINEYKMIYMTNLQAFKNPYYQGAQRGFFLNIGYPAPDYCLDTLLRAYKEAFARNNDISDSEFSVSITPLEYSGRRNNIIKYSNGYQLQVQMIKKMEKNPELLK